MKSKESHEWKSWDERVRFNGLECSDEIDRQRCQFSNLSRNEYQILDKFFKGINMKVFSKKTLLDSIEIRHTLIHSKNMVDMLEIIIWNFFKTGFIFGITLKSI